MRPPHDPAASADSHAEIVATEAALKRGDLPAARQHLHLASQLGAPDNQTQWLTTAIQTAGQVQQRSALGGGGRGLAVGLVGYLCLSLKQPLDWPMPLWIFLAFLLVPTLVGFVVGRRQRQGRAPGRSFWTAAKSSGAAMGLYSALHLVLIGGPHSSAANAGEELIAGLLTIFVFAVLAGLAAGATSAAVVGIQAREAQV